MTKNISLLCFSFVFNDLLAPKTPAIPFAEGKTNAASAYFSTLSSNARPDTEMPYQAARARTIPDSYAEVKSLI